MKKIIICATMLSALSGAAMADLGTAAKVGKFGKWTVLRDVDKMTDKTSCTGVQGEKYEIQLTDKALYARVSGGIESVTVRFDQNPARPFRLATEMEKKIRAVIIDDYDYREALRSKKILIQVSTLVSGTKTIEIDSAGIDQASQLISGGCQTADTPPEEAAALSAPSDALCTNDLKERMRGAGIKSAQIAKVCN